MNKNNLSCDVLKKKTSVNHFLLIMRTAIILLFTCVFISVAETGYTQNAKVTLNKNSVDLKEILNEIENQTDYLFIYNNEVNTNKTVSVKTKNETVRNVLTRVLKDSNIDFSMEGNHIILSYIEKQLNVMNEAETRTVQQKSKTITGTIVDAQGETIIGANIIEKGTSNGTITDFDGKFTLEVNDGAVLRISYIGYLEQELSTVGRNTINVTLIEDTKTLDELVVIGYGVQSRTKVAGAVGTIDNNSMEKVAALSFEQQLAGKMSGVIVNQSNGQPGADSQIIIRGTGTLTAGTNPLIVVDGFPLSEGSSLNSVNPNDIDEISILKDAASASIYGSRAANGVILVTTKKGTTEKTRITLDVYTGFQQQSSGVELVDAYEYAQFQSEARDWGYVSKDPNNRSVNDPNSVRVTKKIKGKNIDGRELRLDYLQPYLEGTPGLINTDWMDEAFRNAPMSNIAISFSGGNKNTKFYSSLGYFDQKGIVIGTDIKRYSASFSLENKLSDRIKIGFNIKPSYTIKNDGDQGSRSSGVLALLALSAPIYSPYKEDGSLNISDQLVGETRSIEGVRINGTPVENLVAIADKVKNKHSQYKTFGNIFTDIDIFNDFKYRFSMGGDYDSYIFNHYYPMDVGSYRTPAPRSDAESNERKTVRINYLVENTLNYKKTINKHNFNALIGHTFQKEKRDYSRINGTGFPDDNIQNIAGASNYSVTSNINTWTLESYLARIQYDFDAKYLFSAAIRRDGSSRFGVDNRWGNFPSVSVGWIMSRESFFPTSDIFPFAKLSASWGKTGNNQIGDYSSYALVTNSNYVHRNAIAPGYITTSAPNPLLGWEVASSINIGLDLGFFNNKVGVELAYYKTNTKDLLLDVPVPQQSGYENVLANIGEMENKGLEIQLSAGSFQLGDFSLMFNGNITTYKNKVLALGPGQNRIATGLDQAFVTQIGRPIAEIYGYEIDGIYKTQDQISNSPHLDGTLTGDYIVKDINNDGVINEKDKVSKGTFAPDFTYGFGSDISYKSFSLGFNFSGVGGRTLMDRDIALLTESGEGFGIPTKHYYNNRYHPENNPSGFLGQPNYANFSNARKLVNSSIVVEKNNGNYLRLRDVRFAYDFNRDILNKMGLEKLQLYLSANNVFTLTDYRGWNPDGSSSNILESGSNSGNNYPIAKSFMIGFKAIY